MTKKPILSLAASGTHLFAGTRFGGVFHSTNNGINWVAANNGLTDTYASSLAVFGTNLFMGTLYGAYFFPPTTVLAGNKPIMV